MNNDNKISYDNFILKFVNKSNCDDYFHFKYVKINEITDIKSSYKNLKTDFSKNYELKYLKDNFFLELENKIEYNYSLNNNSEKFSIFVNKCEHYLTFEGEFKNYSPFFIALYNSDKELIKIIYYKNSEITKLPMETSFIIGYVLPYQLINLIYFIKYLDDYKNSKERINFDLACINFFKNSEIMNTINCFKNNKAVKTNFDNFDNFKREFITNFFLNDSFQDYIWEYPLSSYIRIKLTNFLIQRIEKNKKLKEKESKLNNYYNYNNSEVIDINSITKIIKESHTNKQLQVFLKWFFEDKSHKDIATELGISENNSRQIVFQLKKFLENYPEKDEFVK